MARSTRAVPGCFNLLASTADVGRGRNLAGSQARAIVHAGPSPIAELGRSFSRRHIHHGEKGGSAVGKSRRGKGTKCMVVVDGQGVPVGVQLASAQIAECRLAETTVQQVKVPRVGCGRPRSHLRRVIADRGYDSDALRTRFKQCGMELTVPYRKNVRNPQIRGQNASCVATKNTAKSSAPTPGCKTSAASRSATTASSLCSKASSTSHVSSSP